ncbi:MAG: MBOAT family protein [Chloroflexi bacterium]|nr:MBOAT family protein [Chloroflexota bacterium]
MISLIFYAFAGWQFLPLLLGLSLATYLSARRGWAGWGVAVNLVALGAFKYWNFGVENINWLNQTLGLAWSANLLKLALPLGISFFVFKHIGYLLDVRSGRYEAEHDVLLFAVFSAFFPQISAGPLSNFKETASQLRSLPQRLDQQRAYAGLIFISMGLAKKSLIADSFGTLLASDFNSIQGFSGFLPAWYLVLAYAMQLYFDFSGYTDMALGIGMFFGVSLPSNFNNPYLAVDPADFWNRWHISLSTWFRNYLFFPISRNFLRGWGQERREQAQFASNLITMSLVGLWHGAGWGFILWGVYHGLLLNLNIWWKRFNHPLPVSASRLLFLFNLMLGWALFMSPNLAYLKHLFLQLFGFGGFGTSASLRTLGLDPATLALIFAVPFSLSGLAEAASLVEENNNRGAWIAVLWGILAAVSLLFLQKDVQFLYVQF